ncbi:hypothetical protein A2U01_0047581 [Trifolium medium]|uniref:Uncharacterized protein n=1 Tax=Trifolium medium TaxID=97028 RepID=A0A392QS88_9FABA|nr:hypothetical protein [Trifolium medium]
MSISDEHFELAEQLLCEEPFTVLLDEVSSDVGDDAVFDSVSKGSHTPDAAEVVCAVECMQCLTKEDSVSIGLEISCEEASLSCDSAVGCFTCGFCNSRSLRDSFTASINI